MYERRLKLLHTPNIKYQSCVSGMIMLNILNALMTRRHVYTLVIRRH